MENDKKNPEQPTEYVAGCLIELKNGLVPFLALYFQVSPDGSDEPSKQFANALALAVENHPQKPDVVSKVRVVAGRLDTLDAEKSVADFAEWTLSRLKDDLARGDYPKE